MGSDIIDIQTNTNKNRSPSPASKSNKKSVEKELYAISGWGLNEKDICENLKHYFEHLDSKMKQSFSSLPIL